MIAPVVGISLLTLVPGELGGSETYVRELLRGLGRVGEHTYRVLAAAGRARRGRGPARPRLRPSTGRARTVPQRLPRWAQATLRPGPLRARLADAGVVHYPLTIRIPRVPQPTRRDAARRPAPRPAVDVPAGRARVSQRRLAPLGARRRPGDRDQRVRPRPRDRSASASIRRASGSSRSASTTPRCGRGRRARAVPALPGARAGRTRTTSGSSRRSRSFAASGRNCGSC